MCIAPPPPNLTCDEVGASNFDVVSLDPHGFDGDNDGIGCDEGGSSQQPNLDEPDNPGSNDSLDFGGLISRLADSVI